MGNLKNRDLDGQEIHDTDNDDVVVSARNSAESIASPQSALNEDGFSIDGPSASPSDIKSELVEETTDEEMEEEGEDDEEGDDYIDE